MAAVAAALATVLAAVSVALHGHRGSALLRAAIFFKQEGETILIRRLQVPDNSLEMESHGGNLPFLGSYRGSAERILAADRLRFFHISPDLKHSVSNSTLMAGEPACSGWWSRQALVRRRGRLLRLDSLRVALSQPLVYLCTRLGLLACEGPWPCKTGCSAAVLAAVSAMSIAMSAAVLAAVLAASWMQCRLQ